jgi:hypothetical protein
MTGLQRLRANRKLHDVDRWDTKLGPLGNIAKFILEEMSGGAGHTVEDMYDLVSEDSHAKLRKSLRPAIFKAYKQIVENLAAQYSDPELETILEQIQHDKYYSGRGWKHWTPGPGDIHEVGTVALLAMEVTGGVQ